MLFRNGQIKLSERYYKLVLPTNVLQLLEVGRPHARDLSVGTIKYYRRMGRIVFFFTHRIPSFRGRES